MCIDNSRIIIIYGKLNEINRLKLRKLIKHRLK
jgi:hypothetical protein